MATNTDALSRTLGAWSSSLEAEHLPTEVEAFARRALLDFFRACAVGTTTPWARMVLETIRVQRGVGPALVVVFGDRMPVTDAALIHGAFAHACDIDDSHVGGMVHPGAAVIPAIFGAAALCDADGRTLLAALIAGYEATIRLSLAIQPWHFRQGFQATGTCGAIGAAVGAARALGLDAETVANAIGIAASRAGGLAQFYHSGSSVKRLHAGFAANAGLGAALLARQGLTGPFDALEGQAGFGAAYGHGIDGERLLTGLGRTFTALETTVKVHATSARLQAYVEAVATTVRQSGLPTSEIVAIETPVPAILIGRLTANVPPDITAAQMSLPFTAGLTAVKAACSDDPVVLTSADYSDHIDHPEVRRLAAACRCPVRTTEAEYNPEADSVPGHARLQYRDGRILENKVSEAEGSPHRPLSLTSLEAVLRQSAVGVVDETACARLTAAVRDVERHSATELLDFMQQERTLTVRRM